MRARCRRLPKTCGKVVPENQPETILREKAAHWIKPRGLVMDFQEQAHQHAQIREALIAAIAKRHPFDSAALPSDRLCPTGCWLHGEGARRWAGNHAFLGLLEAHRSFHQHASLVADLISRGQWAEAQRAFRTGSPFTLAHADLNAALRRMRAAAATLAA
jgi:hypothetical protein